MPLEGRRNSAYFDGSCRVGLGRGVGLPFPVLRQQICSRYRAQPATNSCLVSSSAPMSLISTHLRHRITRHVGFTLIEMMVVIGIISIMLVAVIPIVSSLSKSSGRKGAVGNLLSAIEQARAQ